MAKIQSITYRLLYEKQLCHVVSHITWETSYRAQDIIQSAESFGCFTQIREYIANTLQLSTQERALDIHGGTGKMPVYNAMSPAYQVCRAITGDSLKAHYSLSKTLSFPFTTELKSSIGKTLKTFLYHCLTVGGLSLIHSHRKHVLANRRRLFQGF